jgi:hypothetical protein
LQVGIASKLATTVAVLKAESASLLATDSTPGTTVVFTGAGVQAALIDVHARILRQAARLTGAAFPLTAIEREDAVAVNIARAALGLDACTAGVTAIVAALSITTTVTGKVANCAWSAAAN